jgi:acetylornithine deacetylase/succinyl-diaminopimelate desuccinylase-like protein
VSISTPDAARVIAELRPLDEDSGGGRVAWSQAWEGSRAWLRQRLDGSADVELDEAGNLWTPTAIAEYVEAVLDLRHGERDALVELARESTEHYLALRSGALHDSAAIARAGVPTAMIFVRTRGGGSHSRAEGASESDLADGIRAFAQLARAVIDRSC